MTAKNHPDKTNQAMETFSIRQIKDWMAKNIKKTLFAEKTELYKFQ